MVDVSGLVVATRSETALRTAMVLPDLRPHLPSNEHLPEPIWLDLYRSKPKLAVAAAKSMVQRPLSKAQLDHVMSSETRAGVVLEAVRSTTPTLEQLTLLLSSPAFTRKLAGQVLELCGDVVDVPWLATAAEKVGGSARMELFLRAPQDFTDEEVTRALTSYQEWGEEWDTARWARLLATRPAVLPGAARSDHPKLRTAAAGCRHLTDVALQRELAELDNPDVTGADTPSTVLDAYAFTWSALVCNPACDLDIVRELEPLMDRLSDYEARYHCSNRLARHPFRLDGPFEGVEDPGLLAWLLRRTLPNRHKLGGRAYDLPALLANRHLGRGEVTEILTRLAEFTSVLTEPGTRAAARALLERFPEVAEELGERVAEFTDPQPAPADGGGSPDEDADGPDRRQRDAAYGATLRLASLNWASYWTQAAAYLDQELADSPEAWQICFRMLEEGSFAGTVADLAVVVNATAA